MTAPRSLLTWVQAGSALLTQVSGALGAPSVLGLTTAAVERWDLAAPPASPTSPRPKVTVYGAPPRTP